MGTVFEGLHEAIERHVAIKVLRPNVAQNPEVASRFIGEARAVNRVAHPGLVQVSDFGHLQNGSPFIVMEYLAGVTLRTRVRNRGGTLPLNEALELLCQIAESTAAAHAKGVIHRDLKPENIMIVPDPQMPNGERTKLLDFGIAKLITPDDGDHWLTNTQAVMGTPFYMSPEQCRSSRNVDDRSDVYALGCILFELLVGHPPFTAETGPEVLAKHMYEEPPSLAVVAPFSPPQLVELVMRLLSKDKSQRPTMAQAHIELEAILKHDLLPES